MSEAIEAAAEECSPYPDYACFIDSGNPDMAVGIGRALDQDKAVVLVYLDRRTRLSLSGS